MEASDWPREGMNRPIAAASQSVPSPFQKLCEKCSGKEKACKRESRDDHLEDDLCPFSLPSSSSAPQCTIETDVLKDPTGELYKTCRQVIKCT